jgi:hypothetical protein
MRPTFASLATAVAIALLAACSVPGEKFVASIADAAVDASTVDSPPAACEDGSPCCNAVGQFLGAETVCGTRTEYRCEGTCGGLPQQRTIEQHCSGASPSCDGQEVTSEYVAVPGTPTCGAGQFCSVTGDEAPRCTTCPGGCTGDTCAGVQCTAGACCTDGQFEGTDSECSSTIEYRCGGAQSCGAAPQQRTVKKFCTGTAPTCDGEPVISAFTAVPGRGTCAADEICQLNGTSAPTCSECAFGCSGNACEAAECTTGACCVGGRFADTDTMCGSTTEFRCDGTCAGRRQQREVQRFCSGNAATCTGDTVPGAYQTLSTCTADEVCTSNGTGTAPTCTDCEFGCSNNACEPADCTTGACCENGHFRDSSVVCATSLEYQCTTGCGGRPQQRTVEQRCTGAAAGCTGTVTRGSYTNIPGVPACGGNDVCEPNGSAQPTCEQCQFGCENNACRAAEVWVYLSRSQVAGNFGSRSAADNICRNDFTNPSFPDFQNVTGCNVNHVHALLALPGDRLQDMNNTVGVPSNVAISRYPDGITMANNWAGLTGAQLLAPYTPAPGTAQVFWTGGLTPAANQTCSSWTSNASNQVGVGGRTTVTNSWLGVEVPACSNLQRLMCVCWNAAN